MSDVRLDGGPTTGRSAATAVGTSVHYPLTALQSGMLFHQLRGIRGVDLEQLVCRTSEVIDSATFAAALASLVERHPILRTQFVWDADAAPSQEIVAGVTPSLRVLDVRTDVATTEAAHEQDFKQRVRDDRDEGLDLSRAPLMRATMVRYGAGDTRVLLTLHHAIVDGRCFPTLLADLFALYEAHGRNEALPAFESGMVFREFAEWSANHDFESQSRDFWQERLKGFTAPTPLTVDGLPDAGHDVLSFQEELSLSPDETRAIERLAHDAGVTFHTVVQAAWASPAPSHIPGTLAQWFEAQVAKTPEGPALSDGTRSWTYSALDRAANRVAHALAERIVGKPPRRPELVGYSEPRRLGQTAGDRRLEESGHRGLRFRSDGGGADETPAI